MFVLLQFFDNAVKFGAQGGLAFHNLCYMGIQLFDIYILAGVFLLDVGANAEVEILGFDVGSSYDVTEMILFLFLHVGIIDAFHIGRGHFVFVAFMDELLRGIDEADAVVGLVFLQHDDTGGDGGPEEEVAGQLDDGINEIVLHQVFPDFLLCSATV